ncbi:hypothetical protein [Roseimaritima multifibrata]|uniref:hypothetical protein n=1 Tax=Roseimaritima multifibrata TaxID=1930274 RepID=UPI0011A650B6|nr:hypothetical protein [Roseimaritima multifibrata]
MSNRHPTIHQPLNHHIPVTPLSGISNFRMTSMDYGWHSPNSRRTARDVSQPERQSTLPIQSHCRVRNDAFFDQHRSVGQLHSQHGRLFAKSRRGMKKKNLL